MNYGSIQQFFNLKKPSTIPNNIQADIQIIKEDYDLEVKNFHPLVHVQQEQKNNNSSVDKFKSRKERVRSSAHSENLTSVTGTSQEHYKNIRESRNSISKKQKKDSQIWNC